MIRTLFLALFFLRVASAHAVVPGLARFDQYVPSLTGRRVALVVNQASLFGGEHAIDILRARGVRVVKLFALEHGVRGEGGAGENIPDGVDKPTGLPIVSLYGDRRKPDAAALAGVDTIVFDVQDVGVRFFTYISSLGLILEAAAENGRAVVVLDRPNPNGDYVDGPVLKPALRSFVGAYPIPLVYGTTIGELARMIVGEGWKNTRGIKLRVVPLEGYERARVFAPEAPPSPGLRSLQAIRAYPTLGLFEAARVSVGRGTEHAYAVYGVPSPALGPFAFTPTREIFAGQVCYGEEFFSRAAEAVPRFSTDLFTSVRARVGARGFLTDPRFFALLVGDPRVVERLLAGQSWAEIRRAVVEPDLRAYSRVRAKYLLYY